MLPERRSEFIHMILRSRYLQTATPAKFIYFILCTKSSEKELLRTIWYDYECYLLHIFSFLWGSGIWKAKYSWKLVNNVCYSYILRKFRRKQSETTKLMQFLEIFQQNAFKSKTYLSIIFRCYIIYFLFKSRLL